MVGWKNTEWIMFSVKTMFSVTEIRLLNILEKVAAPINYCITWGYNCFNNLPIDSLVNINNLIISNRPKHTVQAVFRIIIRNCLSIYTYMYRVQFDSWPSNIFQPIYHIGQSERQFLPKNFCNFYCDIYQRWLMSHQPFLIAEAIKSLICMIHTCTPQDAQTCND